MSFLWEIFTHLLDSDWSLCYWLITFLVDPGFLGWRSQLLIICGGVSSLGTDRKIFVWILLSWAKMRFLMTAKSKGSFDFLCPFSTWRSGPDDFSPLLQQDIQSCRNTIAVSFTTVTVKVHNPVCFREEKAMFSFPFLAAVVVQCVFQDLCCTWFRGIFFCYTNNCPCRWKWDIFPSKITLS